MIMIMMIWMIMIMIMIMFQVSNVQDIIIPADNSDEPIMLRKISKPVHFSFEKLIFFFIGK